MPQKSFFASFIKATVGSVLLLFTSTIFAQTTISGKVKDNSNMPLKGASITLVDSYDGSVTDSLGNYHFSTSEKDSHFLEVSSIGYKTLRKQIFITDTALNVDFLLKEEPNELKAVVITAGTFAVDDKRKAVTVLNSLDVATIGGGNADISTAMKTLPGAQQIGEQEGLFVRGGTGQETKQFIDGTLVANPYGTSVPDLASRGRFSPFLFKGMVFSTGGYSALYGQALSSALILESIDLPEQSTASFNISPILAGAGFQQLAKNKKSSWGANYNYTNLIAYFNLVPQTPDYYKMPVFHNADGNFRIKTKNGIIKYYTSFGHGVVGLRRPDIDSITIKDAFGLQNNNWYNNLSWRENLGKGWLVNLGAGYSINNDHLEQQLQNHLNEAAIPLNSIWMYSKNFQIRKNETLSQVKTVISKNLWGLSTARFGAEYQHSTYNFNYNDSIQRRLNDNYAALFAEADMYATNNLVFKLGGRLENSSILHKVNIFPRLAIAYKVGKDGQFSGAYGIFYQKPDNEQLIYTTDLGYQRADHYIVNYQKMSHNRIFRVDAFYKKYKDLIKSHPINFNANFYNNAGTGYAKGLEIFLRDKQTFKHFDYWLSYSYLDTKRNFMNFPELMEPSFAAKHTASAVVKHFIPNWKTGFNLTYNFATGRPYYDLSYNPANNSYTIRDKGRTIAYNSLGFSLNYVPSAGNPKAKTFWVLVASVTNVLGSNQVYGYSYSFDGANRMPINPPAKRFFFIGAFFSRGVDRTQEAINNNL